MSLNVKEAQIFGENLHLHRTLRSHVGKNRIKISDVVENVGFQAVPLSCRTGRRPSAGYPGDD